MELTLPVLARAALGCLLISTAHPADAQGGAAGSTSASPAPDVVELAFVSQHPAWKAHIEWVLHQLNSCRQAIDDKSPCNRFVGEAVERIWGAKDFRTGKPPPQDFMVANQIADKLLTDRAHWVPIGLAGDQAALLAARSWAEKGHAVVAVLVGKPNGHVAMVLPGDMRKSPAWDRIVPNSASMFFYRPLDSYVGKPLAFAFSKEDSKDVKLYYRIR